LAEGLIRNAVPQAGVEGGEVVISCEGFDASDYHECRVLFGSHAGRLVSASPSRVIAAIPEYGLAECADHLALESHGAQVQVPFKVGTKLADNLHPVANPAIDREDGSIYATLSGTRGQKVPVSIYQISRDGSVTPFISEIINPTGIAFDREGVMFVTSRFDGTLYRVSPFKEVKAVATDLGIATGVAFNSEGEAFIGDRSGTIYAVNQIGEPRAFATLEPSVAAYHLAFGPDGDLFVTGPTVSSFESIYRIDPTAQISRFYTGLGRPQGLAFDSEGSLYVAASLRGHRGIVRISADGDNAEVIISGSSLVGLAIDQDGNAIVAAKQCLYQVLLGIRGFWPF
jgi:sugar lactone lactonase YvrE